MMPITAVPKALLNATAFTAEIRDLVVHQEYLHAQDMLDMLAEMLHDCYESLRSEGNPA